MNLSTAQKRLSRWWQMREQRKREAPSRINYAGESTIEDMDYVRPPVLPAAIRVSNDRAALKEWLVEAEKYYQGQFDKPYRNAQDMPYSMPVDDPLQEWDYTTRLTVVSNCRAAYHRNPVAKRAVDVTRQFAVGKGHTVTAQNKEVQEILDAFRDNPDNNIFGYERSLLQDLQVDGELIIRFFKEDGQTIMVPLPPWHITDIETDPGFFRRATKYHLYYQPYNVNSETPQAANYVDEWIDADDILHVAINNSSYELRGRPDLYVILPWLKAYSHWLEDRYRQNKWRGALLWWVKIAAAAAGTIAQKASQYRKPPTPGSVVVTSDKEEWSVLNNPINAGDASEDGRQLRMNCATGMGLAEYMLGDGENANLATATAQQLPALWKFTDAQQLMAEQVWSPIYRRVLQAAIDNGDLKEEVEVQDADGDPVEDSNGKRQTVKTIKAFTVEYYELASDDPKTLAEAISLDLNNDLVSVETARGKRGYDHNIEKKRINNEREEMRDEVAQGVAMGVGPDGLPMQPPQQAQGQAQRNGQNGQDDEQR